jgi:hypothetical protein
MKKGEGWDYFVLPLDKLVPDMGKTEAEAFLYYMKYLNNKYQQELVAITEFDGKKVAITRRDKE